MSTLVVVAPHTANTETADLIVGSTLVQVKHSRRDDKYSQAWQDLRHTFSWATAISDSAFHESADVRIFVVGPKSRRPWMAATDVAGRWWIADSPSFSLAAMRIGVVEVERRALGSSGDMSTIDPELYFWAPVGDSPQVREAVTATIATHRRNEPQLPEPGRNWAHEHRLRFASVKSWLLGRKSAFIAHIHAGSVDSDAAPSLADAFVLAYYESWHVMRRATSVEGLRYLCSWTRRDRQFDDTRQARMSLRDSMLRRCAGACRPGQIVTASPRVCRGPNSAGEQPTRTHPRSAPRY